ncbi:MAG TPA: J domain-containing protein [Caulobacteraceae bacterium]|nr:J domain-containing protein [Caulobacteraceae bacterium]
MTGAFQYRPKFVDIRVRPPKPEEDARADDVNALKPGERACDHPGCRLAAQTRAPKSRDLLNEHYWFCTPHAADYNRHWDFFSGMNDAQVRAYQAGSATGDRPTWAFEASRRSREAMAARSSTDRAFADPFGLFAAARRRAEQAAQERKIGKIERGALADLDLDASAQPQAIRARYIELVKRCHPDANGGDRSAEHKLQRVIRAYQALRKAKMA